MRQDVTVFESECWANRNAKYLRAIHRNKKIGPGNFEWTNVSPRDRGVVIDGEWISTHEAMKVLGVSRQRIGFIRNQQNGR